MILRVLLAGMVLAQVVNPDTPPDPRPGWRWTSDGVWLNDWTQEKFPGDALPPRPAPGPYVYSASFDDGPDEWASLGYGAVQRHEWTPAGKAGGAFVSTGPWWLDTNQGTSEMGSGLHMVAYLYTRDMLPGIHYHRVDLRGALLTLWLHGEDVALEGSHLVVWVQAKVGDRASNWALTGQPLDAEVLAGDWTPVERRFDDESAWTCLDALGMRPDVYACAPLDTVLGDGNADWGLLLYPIPTPGAPPRLPRGQIKLDEVRLEYQLTPR
jgi:hypothetical protein